MANLIKDLGAKLTGIASKPEPIEINIAGNGIKSGFGRVDKANARTHHKYGADLSYDSWGKQGSAIGNIYKDGKVVSANASNKGVGNQVVIDYGGGVQIAYNHLDSIGVKPGQTISRGASLGTMGASGNSPSGAHISYEFRKDGKVVAANTALPDASFNKEQWGGKEGSWGKATQFDMKSKSFDASVSSGGGGVVSSPTSSSDLSLTNTPNKSYGGVNLGNIGISKQFGGGM